MTTMEHKRRKERQYIPKACGICSRQAYLAINVLSRTVGRGQNQERRHMKTSSTIRLCKSCANGGAYRELLAGIAAESLQTCLPFAAGER